MVRNKESDVAEVPCDVTLIQLGVRSAVRYAFCF